MSIVHEQQGAGGLGERQVSRGRPPKVEAEERWRGEIDPPTARGRDWRNLCAFLRARFGPGPPDPEDIAQLAFFKVSERGDTLGNPRAYLFRVAINLMLDEVRTLARRRRAMAASAPLLADELDDQPGAERALIAKQQVAFLQKVVDGMPQRHQQYLLASQVEGRNFVAIAEQFGVSPSLVRKTVDEAVMVCQQALATGTIDYRGLSRERSRRP